VVLEGRDGDTHPFGEWKGAEETVELGFTFGAVKAEDPGLAGCDAAPPEPHKVSLVDEFGRGDRFGSFAVAYLRLWCGVWSFHIELDQEFHDFLLLPVILTSA
jgi:hypothetical protein